MKLWLVLVGFYLFVAPPGHAFTIDQVETEQTLSIEDYIKDYVDVPDGGVDWKLFGTTQEISIETKTDDGYDMTYSKPDFQPEVMALAGKEIKIKGYMFPLESTDKQALFLFGPFPLTCPFQYHVGPSMVLEVHADHHPVTFDYEPVVITGVLELVPDDPEYSVFYRLNDAKQVQ